MNPAVMFLQPIMSRILQDYRIIALPSSVLLTARISLDSNFYPDYFPFMTTDQRKTDFLSERRTVMKCVRCHKEKSSGKINAYYVGSYKKEFLGKDSFYEHYKHRYDISSFQREELLLCDDCIMGEISKKAKHAFWTCVLFCPLAVAFMIMVLIWGKKNQLELSAILTGGVLILLPLSWSYLKLSKNVNSQSAYLRFLRRCVWGKHAAKLELERVFKSKNSGLKRAYYDAENFERSVKLGLPPYDLD